MQSLQQVSCSLNLGQIYSLNYEYSPQDGVSITVFFVSENGNYTMPQLLPLQKAHIVIGQTSFSMYPIRRKLSLSNGRRVMEVEFCDDLFKLSHYYLALTGRGCGQNVYTLGTPVDDRPLSVKLQTALDPIAQQIKEFTQFPDYAYTFTQFIALLSTKINVQVQASFDGSIQRDYVGTFRGVLEEWLALYNLSYFFENGQLKIFDPTKLTLTLPTQSSLASEGILSYEDEEDIRNTYGKTVFNWYQSEGGQFPLNQVSDSNGPLYVQTQTLYPMGYEFNLSQPTMDLNQVAAAQYGQYFWLLYNYSLGTTSVCGFTPITPPTSLSSVQSVAQVANGNGRVAILNQSYYDQQYEAFLQYGQTLAGRWYMSNELDSLAVSQGFQWFDESQGQIFDFKNVDSKAINLDYLTPTSDGTNSIPDTRINNSFPGFNFVGNRLAYQDTSPVNVTGVFNLAGTSTNQGEIESVYQSLFLQGNQSFDLNTQLAPLYTGNNTFVGYDAGLQIPASITSVISSIPTKTSVFKPRFTSIPIKGIRQIDYATYKSSQSEPDTVSIVPSNQGDNIIANTSVIKTLKQGSYIIYDGKYSQCGSASSPDIFYGYEFQPNQISPDAQVDATFTKNANNSYTLTRNFEVINGQVNSPYLPTLAQGRTFSTKRVSFSLNYFKTVPTNFLTNGLVGMSISFEGEGVRASYSYSNEILEVAGRSRENKAAKQAADYSQRIKNSTLRHYVPAEVIS